MKGVVLAGGLGTRLHPLTDPLNKHLLPVYNEPMIFYALRTFVQSGITDIMILLNGRHPGLFLEMLEDGVKLNCSLTYRYSQYVNGPGRTLLLAESWIGDEEFAVLLGDGVFFTPLPMLEATAPHMFVMELDSLDDPRKYGQVAIEGSRVTRIVWKPKIMFSSIVQTTCFIFPPDAFTRLHSLDRLTSGEVSITSLTSQYVAEGLMRCTALPPRSYIDCGTLEALHSAASIARSTVR